MTVPVRERCGLTPDPLRLRDVLVSPFGVRRFW
jgi:hypothetical protein